MGITSNARISRKLLVSVLSAISLMVLLTAVVSAGSDRAIWSGAGAVLFAGPSNIPGAPTSSEADFKFNRDGSVRSVEITTTNELVAGVLGAGSSAVTRCNDRGHSDACADLDALLTGAQVTSLHTSEATLRRVQEGTVPVPGIGDVETISGLVNGKLEGVFTVSNGGGYASGTAKLRIGEGSTATYACFVNGPVPSPSMAPCTLDLGGQLFPIVMDVNDRGSFEIGSGVGSMADIVSLEGRVQVNAQANLFAGQFGGSITIPAAKATLAAD